MATVDDLQFEEFGDTTTSLAANPDATTISIEDPGETPKHKPGPPRGLGREEDDELLGNDDSDKTELLAGQKKSSPFWTFEYYQTFFDVDTHQVFDRIKGSLLPIPGKKLRKVVYPQQSRSLRPLLDMRHIGLCRSNQWESFQLLNPSGREDIPLCARIPKSVHRSHNHLCLRLAGSSRTLGFPCMEKQ